MYQTQLNDNILDKTRIRTLSDKHLKRIRLVIIDPHFDIDRIRMLMDAAQAANVQTAAICEDISKAILTGYISFRLIRQLSGWITTSKSGGDSISEIIRSLFYGINLQRFSAYNNATVLPNFREIFIPWLISVMKYQEDLA